MTFRARAPLRISFGGGGTDVSPYCDEFGGVVLSCTIDKFAWVTAKSRDDHQLRVHSLDYNLVANYDMERDLVYNGEMDLVKAVVRNLEAPTGLEVFIHSDAPPGSGLGSSSTMAVALIGAIGALSGRPFTMYEIAERAYHAERVELAIKGGLQDQYAATFGGFNFIEFGSNVVVNPLRIPADLLDELEYRLLLCYTGRTRLSGNILERQIASVTQKSGDVLASLHGTKELAMAMKTALLRRNLDNFGDLLHQGWEHKKRFDTAITDARIDEMYEIGRKSGALGGKLLGAGGGGYLLFYCDFTKHHHVANALAEAGGVIMPFRFEEQGLRTWPVP